MSTSTDASCHLTTCSSPKTMMIGAFGMTATAKKTSAPSHCILRQLDVTMHVDN